MAVKMMCIKTSLAAIAVASAAVLVPTQSRADSDPFIGDILLTGLNFCPRGWASADGQLIPISSNTALFSLLGTTYGGDGRTTFGLPDLQGRAAMGTGAGPGLTQAREGQKRGTETVTLTAANLPAHSHSVRANNQDGDRPGPGDKLLAAAPPNGAGSETIYSTGPVTVQMSAAMIGTAGGGQPLGIQDASLVLTYCIATQGVYPSRS